jgi:hypothetical protein
MPAPADHERSEFWIKDGFGELETRELDELRQLWKPLLLEHPVEWFQHRLAVFTHVLGLSSNRLWGPAFMRTQGFPDWITRHYPNAAESTALQQRMEEAFTALDGWWFYRPWFYLVAGTLLGAGLLIFFRPPFGAPLFVVGSGIAHELGLFLAAPSPDYRYSHYLVFSVCLAILMLIFHRPSILRRPKWASKVRVGGRPGGG